MRIEFEDKVRTRSLDLPIKNQITDDDLNEIKTVVNFNNDNAVYTVELIDALTVDVYAESSIKIDSFSKRDDAADITIEVNDSAYALESEIQEWDKITITSDIATIVKLNVSVYAP